MLTDGYLVKSEVNQENFSKCVEKAVNSKRCLRKNGKTLRSSLNRIQRKREWEEERPRGRKIGRERRKEEREKEIEGVREKITKVGKLFFIYHSRE